MGVKITKYVTSTPQVKFPGNGYQDYLKPDIIPTTAVGGSFVSVPMKTSVEVVHSKSGVSKLPEIVEQAQVSQPPMPAAALHTVAVIGGMTINLGNYESAKIQVSLSMPCTKDTLNDAYEFASTWVSEKIEQATKAIKKAKES